MAELKFETIKLACGYLGQESVVPDVIKQSNVQNQVCFDLNETDEIYEGYGQLPNAYPYRQQDTYSRKLKIQEVEAAILENDLMYAVFLPGYGGRLWRLYDKQNQKDLLYTNDCLRASNLAVRNAWFSGGVEWNCGIIGHSPYTMDRIFAAKLNAEGREVLRLYNYERIRGVVYQMDFWLDEEKPALNGHMSIYNPNKEVVPMYWWTNIASPLYEKGRLLVPAHAAYTYDHGTIVKIQTPLTKDGEDTEHYETVRNSKDFFFCLDKGAPRWIANVDSQGVGLLHTSTERLQSRKLFAWGSNDGAQHWQEYLTDQGGPYIELQAGLGKTQYGCIPMAPHTVWQWNERFELLQLTEKQQKMPFEEAAASVSETVSAGDALEKAEKFGEKIRKISAETVYQGTGDGALQDALRASQGLKPMREYLDFTSPDRRQQAWYELLRKGVLPEPETYPACDPCGKDWLELLLSSVQKAEGQNWYAYYCICLLQKQEGRLDLAEKAIRKSLSLRETSLGNFVYAAMLYNSGGYRKAGSLLRAALQTDGDCYSFARAAVQLLMSCELWSKALSAIQMLPEHIREDPRIRLFMIRCLYELKHYDQAYALLEKDGGLELDDVREGEVAMGDLWTKISRSRLGKAEPVPHRYNFDALGIGYDT